MIYGYARVSTDGQSVDAQVKALHAAGAEKVISDVVLSTGKLPPIAVTEPPGTTWLDVAASVGDLWPAHARDAVVGLSQPSGQVVD